MVYWTSENKPTEAHNMYVHRKGKVHLILLASKRGTMKKKLLFFVLTYLMNHY